MLARIYRPSRNTMQSGTAHDDRWRLEFAPAMAKSADPLMGWTTSGDMNAQVRMTFASREEAVRFAEKHGMAYEIEEPRVRRRVIKSYADNFRPRPA